MSDSSSFKPPYIAYTTFKNFLESFPDGVIPGRIDKTVMSKQSGSGQASILSTLRFFEMIDGDGKPTQNFHDVVEGGAEFKQATWKRLVEKGYGFIFSSGLDLQRTTEGQLAEKFRAYDLNGDTLRKCQVFFVSVCELGGIPLGPLLLKSKSRGAGALSGVSRRKPRKQGGTTEPLLIPPPTKEKSVQELLLEKFPAFNPEWSADIQTQWFAAYQKLLNSDAQ